MIYHRRVTEGKIDVIVKIIKDRDRMKYLERYRQFILW